jgi:excinuclease ABC subunit C
VVFDAEGPVRAQYRRYNISEITPGDDYAAMQQALSRRFRRAVEDGRAARSAADRRRQGAVGTGIGRSVELDVQGVTVIGVAKGEERRPGHETLVFADGRQLRPGRIRQGCS